MVWLAGLVILSCCCGWFVVYLFSARSELLGLSGGFWACGYAIRLRSLRYLLNLGFRWLVVVCFGLMIVMLFCLV